MPPRRGTIALMGSGELTATMVEVHKALLSSLSVPPNVAFLDTPAGFQLNVDFLSERAAEYFRQRIQHPLAVASYKSREETPPSEAEKAFRILREAGYILIGPGSPTYAVRQWRDTPIAPILKQRIEAGGCLVAASAAALTVGRCTLPVYEIYKVGHGLYWEKGLDILGHFGFDLVVIPHWNNAEGGTHDTRFCYMGEARFRKLEEMLPPMSAVLGLDEHTACLIDLEADAAQVRGIGKITLRRGQEEVTFGKGERFSLELLREKNISVSVRSERPEQGEEEERQAEERTPPEGDPFWEKVHGMEDTFQEGLEQGDFKSSTNALLELDRLVWEAQLDLENPEFISQARELFRELIVFLGHKLESSPRDRPQSLSSVVESLLALREEFRKQEHWEAADAIRTALLGAGVVVEDDRAGSRWHLAEEEG